MVVERGHLEHALAVRELEIADLDDVRQGLDDVHDAERHEDERHIVGKGQRRDRAAEKERTRVAHEHLRRVEIIDQKAQQAAGNAGGEHTEGQKPLAPEDGDDGEEDAHRHRRARGEAVHTVGEVHGVDRADDDEGRKDHIQRLGDRHRLVPERDVQAVERDIAEAAHEENERHGRRQLQQHFFAGRQAEILLFLELFIVVQKADRAEHERERQTKQVAIFALGHALKADRQAHDRDRGNKHQPAHGGRALLGHVPRGAVFLDALARLDAFEIRDQEKSDDGRHRKRDDERQYQLQCHFSLFLFSSISATISRSSICTFVLPMIW